MNWEEMAVVARVARTHGLRGQMILDSETDFPDERFQPGAELFVRIGASVEKLTLTSVRFQNGRPVVGAAGVESIERAQRFAGCELRVPSITLMPLAEGQFYLHDLVGCRVETKAGEGIGVVTSVEGANGASRLVLRGSDDDEILVPFVEDICRRIDVGGKLIVIEPPEGLLEVNRRGSASA